MARGHEGGARLAGRAASQIPIRTREAKDIGSGDVDGRVGQQARERVAGCGRPGGHEDGGRHACQAQRQEPQERHGLFVPPVGVVDGQQQRLGIGELGEQPVEAIKHPFVRAGAALRGGLARTSTEQGRARPANSSLRPITMRSSAWRTTPKAKPRSSSLPRAASSCMFRASAPATAASTSAVFPMPGSPSNTSTRPRP